jgi:hypothetical protein
MGQDAGLGSMGGINMFDLELWQAPKQNIEESDYRSAIHHSEGRTAVVLFRLGSLLVRWGDRLKRRYDSRITVNSLDSQERLSGGASNCRC